MKFIGFIVVWVIGATILAMLINFARAKRGETIDDSTTAFMEGLVWGPVGILSALNPSARAKGKAGPQLFGGLVSTAAGYWIYTSL